jgi:hypothetical protein
MKPARLLRWYPRAWRERYGEELLALIQDTLDDGRPAWRLRLGVIWGGLRERGHQAKHAGRTAVKRMMAGPGPSVLVAGLVLAYLPVTLMQSPLPARRWLAAAAFGTVLGAVTLTGAVVLANGLAALPALVRFLRAGGWAKIRRRVAWAAGATTVAGGGLAALVLVSTSYPHAQLNTSLAYLIGLLADGLAMATAIGLWIAVAAATARHLTLAPRVRAVQLVLTAVAAIMVTVVVAALDFWWSVTQAPHWLVAGLVMLALASVDAWRRIPRAVRRGRRLRTQGRHQA